MIWSSVYEAMILMATCFKPAKKIPSPTPDSKSRYFSSSVRLKVFCRISIVVGDCFNNNWIEAWWMMKSEDTASFLYSIAKRGRKYYLGLSTITQDAADFMK